MTGAAACLAGFKGITVVIHGSSGCYYYPATLLHAPLHGTFILENEVVFGSGDRLRKVIGESVRQRKQNSGHHYLRPVTPWRRYKINARRKRRHFSRQPGICRGSGDRVPGGTCFAFPGCRPGRPGVNIDGVSLSDPFYEGNLEEISRILHRAGIPVGTVFCRDLSAMAEHASPLTIGTNEDFGSGVGKYVGGTLGIPVLRATCERLSAVYEDADMNPVFTELDLEEERVIHICDKFLRRYDPPGVAVFAGASYAFFAADTLKRYLDAQILVVGTRNDPPEQPGTRYRVEKIMGLEEIDTTIRKMNPDLVIGSSFERSLCVDRAFVGIIPPLRGRVRLAHTPLAGY